MEEKKYDECIYESFLICDMDKKCLLCINNENKLAKKWIKEVCNLEIELSSIINKNYKKIIKDM